MGTAVAIEQLWTAVYALLTTLTVPTIGSVPVLESPAPGMAYPYVTYAVAFAEHGRAAGEAVLQVDVWDSAAVEKIIAIQAALAALLDGKVVTWSGGTATLLAASTPPIGRDPDGTTRHGVQLYRVLVHT